MRRKLSQKPEFVSLSACLPPAFGHEIRFSRGLRTQPDSYITSETASLFFIFPKLVSPIIRERCMMVILYIRQLCCGGNLLDFIE